MPARFRKRRTPARRTVKKRSIVVRRTRPSRPSRALPLLRTQWKNPLPKSGSYKFVYNDTGFSLSTTVGNGYQTVYQFRGNSLFDPDLTGVGVQPYGFDQLCATAGTPFGIYQVVASKIVITAYFPDLTAVPQARLLIIPTGATLGAGWEWEDLRRMPYSRALNLNTATRPTAQLRKYVTTKQMFPARKVGDSDYVAGAAANPATSWWWYFYFDTASTSQELTLLFDVKITYYAKLAKSVPVQES